MESVNVMCANLPDLIIDYPKAKLYANEILQKAVDFKIVSKEDAGKYTDHIENLES